jgi:glycosidase
LRPNPSTAGAHPNPPAYYRGVAASTRGGPDRAACTLIDDLWYKNGVLYCLSVGTYMDPNGDGIGDFKGLLRRLDYLQGFGITTIWLMPFQPSPGKDDGYDTSDYYGVNPRYGTLGDFVEFTHGCSQRVIRVIIDLVVNHTSDAHPRFRKARSSPDSEYRHWYVWSKRLTQKQPQKGRRRAVIASQRVARMPAR